MSLEQVIKCDHCGKIGARPYLIVLYRIKDTDKDVLLNEGKDLCSKCYDRCGKFIQRGMTAKNRTWTGGAANRNEG